MAKQQIEEKRKLDKMRLLQEAKQKQREDQEKAKIERQQERDAMRQEFLRKKKLHSDTDNGVAFEIVGVPEVLLQEPQPRPRPKQEAFTVDFKNDDSAKKPRRSKAERSSSVKKNVQVFGDVEILVSEKDISKINQRKQQQEREKEAAFTNYKQLIERSIDVNPVATSDVVDLQLEVDSEGERDDDPGLDDAQIEANLEFIDRQLAASEETKQPTQVNDVEERPQKPNNTN